MESATAPRDTAWAMSQESVEDFIRRGYARFNQAEREPVDEQELASLDIWHPDGVYVNSASDPDPATHRGIEAVRRQIGQWVEAYPDLQVEPLEIQTNGDRVFVWVRVAGHGAESGVPIAMEMAHVNTVEDGKLRSVEEYQERTDGLKAAGLSE
jgi:ketosteroid isomerase-like protein